MKKIYLSAALAMAAAGSWAFYPKAAEPSGYMMVVSSSRFSGQTFNAKNSIAVITPDGKITVQDGDAQSGAISRVPGSLEQLHLNETKTLNELRRAGWRIVSSSQTNVSNGAISETIYVLEK